jgi:hypothetical protein
MVIDLNDPNETIMFSRSILGTFFFETFFGGLEDDLSPLAESYKKYELLHSNQITKIKYTLLDCSNDSSIDSSYRTLVNSSLTKYCTQLNNHNLWTVYFDSSRNMHRVDASYLLVDLYGIQTYFFYHLKFECTNNDAKYESLIQRLRKEIDLNVKCIYAFDHSRVVIK